MRSKKRVVVSAEVRPWTEEEQALLREMYALIERQRHHAATQLQQARRRQVAHELRLLAELAMRYAAATKIQSGARASRARMVVNRALRCAHHEHGAATRIQSAIRKRLAAAANDELQASMEQLAAMRLHTICVTRYQRRTAPLESTAEWEAELEPVPFSLGLA